jgi:hypothetical protein
METQQTTKSAKRERTAAQKAVQFKRGVPKKTRAGSENKTTRHLKDALIIAAEEMGDLSGIKDLSKEGVEKGKQGLVGYLKWVGKTQPRSFMAVLGRLLPMQVQVDAFAQTVYRSYHEVNVAFGNEGLSLEAIEKLKLIDLKPDTVKDEEPDTVKDRT